MVLTNWVIFMQQIALPSEYVLKTSTSDKVAFQVSPPGSYAVEEYRKWQTPSNKTISLFYWEPRAPRDLGTIVAAQEYPITIAGKETRLIETSQFMGRKQHVLVAHSATL